ncbi:CDP-alcohol phosphatidyltransferase family protein [Blattabacterium cuenoti]|uniref:CDP-alcohol phosphatidyltransferase family protein n=1 Tax=Blattabacterium cuenoti TaxID=1653831 RepID=UPI00163C8310|nr:CDP-alcohol phosphatidyltransferase family protein [Blattabacterium cuenoti]
MKKIIKKIPNTLTLFNLFFGCISLTFLQSKHFECSAFFTMLSLIVDLLDGFFSRFLNIENEFGKELDSLADMVSFGIVPSMIVFFLLKNEKIPFIEWSAFFISIFSAWRLAQFNIFFSKKNEKKRNYYGLSTPINTLFFSSLSMIKDHILLSPIIILMMVFLSCYFLISKIPMFSFYFDGFSWKKNKIRYLFLLMSIFLLLTLHMFSLPCIIIFYIITSISIYYNKLNRKNSH